MFKDRSVLLERLVEVGCPRSRAASILLAIDQLERTGSDGLGSTPSSSVLRARYRRELYKVRTSYGEGPDGNEDKGALIRSDDQFRHRRRSGRTIRWGRGLNLIDGAAAA